MQNLWKEIQKSKDAGGFWNTINKFRRRKSNIRKCEEKDLRKHLMEILEGDDKRIKINLKEIIKTNENKEEEEADSYLNREIDMIELEREIKKLKKKKAPDGFPNEFFKMLTRECMEEL